MLCLWLVAGWCFAADVCSINWFAGGCLLGWVGFCVWLWLAGRFGFVYGSCSFGFVRWGVLVSGAFCVVYGCLRVLYLAMATKVWFGCFCFARFLFGCLYNIVFGFGLCSFRLVSGGCLCCV